VQGFDCTTKRHQREGLNLSSLVGSREKHVP
jgi:hypothetical protein